MHKGVLITFEGPEGGGKSTHIRLLAAYLRARLAAGRRARGRQVLVTREPGGTALATGIRRLLLHGKNGISPLAELLLYEADRSQHVRETLMPALRRGTIVLCDRYTDSTVAYQGFGRGIDRRAVASLNAIASEGLQPHLTILLDVDVKRGLQLAKRKKNRHDRLERAGLAFHRRVRAGFLELAKKEPHRIRVIPQQKNVNDTQRRVRDAVDRYLKGK